MILKGFFREMVTKVMLEYFIIYGARKNEFAYEIKFAPRTRIFKLTRVIACLIGFASAYNSHIREKKILS